MKFEKIWKSEKIDHNFHHFFFQERNADMCEAIKLYINPKIKNIKLRQPN